MGRMDERRLRFEQTVIPHLNAAYNLARWLTRNDQDAEDVVQDALVRAYRFFDSLRGDARPWLLAIVRNTCMSWIQANRPAELAGESALEHFPASEDQQPEALLAKKIDR